MPFITDPVREHVSSNVFNHENAKKFVIPHQLAVGSINRIDTW